MNTNKKQVQALIIKSVTLNDEGKILMVRRDEEKYKDAHGKWELPGGGLDFGESPEQTCIRETKEESGYDIEICRMIPISVSKIYDNPKHQSQVLLFAFLCKLVGGEISLDDKNVSQVKWFTRDEIKNLECLTGTCEIIDKINN